MTTAQATAFSSLRGSNTRPIELGVHHKLVRFRLDRLKVDPNNARSHSKAQIKKLARSIKGIAYGNPILCDESGTIIAGHARRLALIENGETEATVLQITGLSEAKRKALALADNRIAQDAGWDKGKLVAILPELEGLLIDEGVDASILGFDQAELDRMFDDFGAAPNEAPEPSKAPAVSRSGDLFLLGLHRLLVGDARDPAAFEVLCGNRKASMAFVDAPYNIAAKKIGGRGRTKHQDFAMGSGEMPDPAFLEFLAKTHDNVATYCKSGSVIFSCMDWRQIEKLIAAGRQIGLEFVNLVVWVKSNAGQGSFYRSKHELIAVFRYGSQPHLNNVQLGRFGRSRSNVWEYAGANSFSATRVKDLADHPTVKPVDLVIDAIKDCTRRGDIVIDCFGGSGTTLLAAEQTGRQALLLELDPTYADVIIRRWQAATGADARHEATGLTFGELNNERTTERLSSITRPRPRPRPRIVGARP